MSRPNNNGGSRARRRTVLISRSFQGKYIGLVVASVFILSCLLTIVLYGVIYQQVRARIIQGAGSGFWESPISVVVLGGAFAVAMAAFCGFWTLLFTHRISGPLMVMRNYMADLANGRLPTMRPLRKKDEFKEFYAAFSRVVNDWQQQRQRELTFIDQALEALKLAGNSSSADSSQALSLATKKLQSHRTEIATFLNAGQGQEAHGDRIAPMASEPTTAYP